MSPTDSAEKASIDEAFLDLTLMVFDRLLARFPYLAAVPDGKTMDSPLPPPPGIDWSKAGNVLPVDGETDDTDEPNMSSEDQVDSVEADPAGYQDTWEDWALCLGAEIMAELRAAVFKELKYTCSAGISHGKAMAKVCCNIAYH